jgi:O-antigen ligase
VWIAWDGAAIVSESYDANTFQDGNPMDRIIWVLLIVLAAGVLLARSFDWGGFFARNFALLAFISFSLLSVAWSDFPLVAFKRWFRDLGNYLIVLVVLSDARPLVAVRAVFRRACYLWIPLSIVLIKYFPALGQEYDIWTGEAACHGVATSKNILGVICLVSGLFFFWDTMVRWSDRGQRRTRWIILVNMAFLAMTFWLLYKAQSATSTVCLALGALAVTAAQKQVFRRSPGLLKWLIPLAFFSYLIAAFAFDMNGQLAGAVGRDPTLTSRTTIWNLLLGMHTNPLLGVGYDSFWLGPRLEYIWPRVGAIGEAHNGFLELYLNLGIIGLLLLLGFFVSSYRKNFRDLSDQTALASFTVALWTIMPFYNVTEAAFRMHLMWVTFLFAAIPVCTRRKRSVETATWQHAKQLSPAAEEREEIAY